MSYDYNEGWDYIESFVDVMIEDTDRLCKEMLDESAPILLDSVKKELKKSIIHSGDSELLDSIHIVYAEKCKNGAYLVEIKPHGYSRTKTFRIARKRGRTVMYHSARKYELPNVLKAIWKEYGIPGKQPATPFFAPATRKAEVPIAEKMQEVFNRKLEGYGHGSLQHD